MSNYVIYWHQDGPNCKFEETLTEALKLTEQLRAQRRAGQPISHITMSIEDSNHVGELGVDVTGPDYDWRKRREDNATGRARALPPSDGEGTS